MNSSQAYAALDVADSFACSVSAKHEEEAIRKAGQQFRQKFPDADVLDWRCTFAKKDSNGNLHYDVLIHFVDQIIILDIDEESIEHQLNTRYSSPHCMAYRKIKA